LQDIGLEGNTALITEAKREMGKAQALVFTETRADAVISVWVFKDDYDDLATHSRGGTKERPPGPAVFLASDASWFITGVTIPWTVAEPLSAITILNALIFAFMIILTN